MKTRDDVIKALGILTRSDREWIIRRLPQATRFALLLGAQEKGAQPISNGANSNDVFASVDPRALVAVFENEPSWVAHALLSTSRSWAEEVRRSLSHSLRQQLDTLDRASITYSPRMIESLEQQLAAAVEKADVTEGTSRTQPLISQVGAWFSKTRVNRSVA